MRCMKCGRETQEGAVFCLDCQVDMEKYPVKPGTAIQLPRRTEAPPSRRVHFRPALTPEEQLKRLRRTIRRLALALAVCLLLLAAGFFFLAEHMKSHADPLPGQNYSAVTTTPET